jgi:leucyl/phenylalanyl-tRNA--protein transferase
MAASPLVFPHPFLADEDGLLAFSKELTTEQLLLAYRFGIFPWNDFESPILWWFIAPRMVIFPRNIHIAKSMRPYFNQNKYRVTVNREFETVITQCRKIRLEEGEDTWIHRVLKSAFVELHQLGYAHSIEVWDEDNKLSGGLYGLALGKIFFGESMFFKKRDASKFALIKLAQMLEEAGFWLIDCQVYSEHMKSMGAELISKEDFMDYLRKNIFEEDRYFRQIDHE